MTGVKQSSYGNIGGRNMRTKKTDYLLTDKYFDKLSFHFNILGVINFQEFDYDFDVLKDRLTSLNQESFGEKDKIIITHFDTDYYDCNFFKFGLNFYNFFSVIDEMSIPHFVFIICTNYFGISKEIEEINKNHDPDDKPIVIETFITSTHYCSEVVNDIPVNIENIQRPALSMMGAPRSQRFALYNFIKQSGLIDKIEISIKA